MPLLAYWTHDLSPFLVRFSDNFGIRYYGLAYLLGFVGAWWLLRLYHQRGRSPFDGGAIARRPLQVPKRGHFPPRAVPFRKPHPVVPL